MGKVYIIGIGPGSEEYITPEAWGAIQDAEVIIGSERILSAFKLDKRSITLKGNYSEIIDYIKGYKDSERIAVLVSGDPGIFSFSNQISKRLNRDEYEIIPGISVVQIAMARLGEPWHDLHIISLHGRGIDGIYHSVQSSDKVFVFTDKKNTPSEVAAYLYKRGIKNREIVVFENLTLFDEKIIYTDIMDLMNKRDDVTGLCVMLIRK
ncbi:MAG: precorrin-6y C5,15-methyltransferase (decarboxylating) subunit CbiE [Spirochaetota bacterium]|nr:precorrin-6y C5,15-methyltransferase (decarboxylating) subunit CbiE [Spirochaetota bacterium]